MINDEIFVSHNTWYFPAHMGLLALTLVLQLGSVYHGVRLVDRVVAVQAAVV